MKKVRIKGFSLAVVPVEVAAALHLSKADQYDQACEVDGKHGNDGTECLGLDQSAPPENRVSRLHHSTIT